MREKTTSGYETRIPEEPLTVGLKTTARTTKIRETTSAFVTSPNKTPTTEAFHTTPKTLNDLDYIQYYDYSGSGDLYDYPEETLSIYSPGKICEDII